MESSIANKTHKSATQQTIIVVLSLAQPFASLWVMVIISLTPYE
jgi:hypothetical protein